MHSSFPVNWFSDVIGGKSVNTPFSPHVFPRAFEFLAYIFLSRASSAALSAGEKKSTMPAGLALRYWENSWSESLPILQEVLFHAYSTPSSKLHLWTTSQLIDWLKQLRFLSTSAPLVIEAIIFNAIDGESFANLVSVPNVSLSKVLKLTAINAERIRAIIGEWSQPCLQRSSCSSISFTADNRIASLEVRLGMVADMRKCSVEVGS